MILNYRMFHSVLLLLICLPFQSALAESQSKKWPKPAAIFLTSELPSGGPAGNLSGNTKTWRATAAEAADRWNRAQTAFKLSTSNASGSGNCTSYGDNILSFSSTSCGIAFGANTLAATRGWSIEGTSTIIKADIIFNSNKTWGIYDGAIRYTLEDFSRVAMHELGHAMGLAHTTVASALMYPTASDTYLPSLDDVESLNAIYVSSSSNSSSSSGGGSMGYLVLALIPLLGLRFSFPHRHKKAD